MILAIRSLIVNALPDEFDSNHKYNYLVNFGCHHMIKKLTSSMAKKYGQKLWTRNMGKNSPQVWAWKCGFLGQRNDRSLHNLLLREPKEGIDNDFKIEDLQASPYNTNTNEIFQDRKTLILFLTESSDSRSAESQSVVSGESVKLRLS